MDLLVKVDDLLSIAESKFHLLALGHIVCSACLFLVIVRNALIRAVLGSGLFMVQESVTIWFVTKLARVILAVLRCFQRHLLINSAVQSLSQRPRRVGIDDCVLSGSGDGNVAHAVVEQ